MLEYDRNDVSEKINVSKTNGLHKCVICHYWCILEISFRFQPEVCNGCHNLMQKTMSFNNFSNAFLKEIIIEFIFGIRVKMKL